jgi:hypothetical protein
MILAGRPVDAAQEARLLDVAVGLRAAYVQRIVARGRARRHAPTVDAAAARRLLAAFDSRAVGRASRRS